MNLLWVELYYRYLCKFCGNHSNLFDIIALGSDLSFCVLFKLRKIISILLYHAVDCRLHF